MQGVTESMAGRAAVLHLLPFSTLESPKVNLVRAAIQASSTDRPRQISGSDLTSRPILSAMCVP